MRYWEYIERIQRAATLNEAKAATIEFSEALGFRNHGYAFKPQQPPEALHNQSSLFYFHDFTNEWADTYRALSRPEAQLADPRVMQARAGYPAAAWDRHGRTSYEPPINSSSVRSSARY